MNGATTAPDVIAAEATVDKPLARVPLVLNKRNFSWITERIAGVIEGPDPGLPAKVTWTPEGHYRIEYADGTVEEFDMWGIMGGLGYGTSGGGGGGTVSTGSTGG